MKIPTTRLIDVPVCDLNISVTLHKAVPPNLNPSVSVLGPSGPKDAWNGFTRESK